MNREQLLALADELATSTDTLRAYAARIDTNYHTLLSWANRAGVRLAMEIRDRRVRAVEREAARTGVALGRCALNAGWSTAEHFYRCRRKLAQRWGRVA